jgi:putative transposase
VTRKQRAFKVSGFTWIVERGIAWLGFNRRLSKDYERYVQTSETLLDIAAIRLMLKRVVPSAFPPGGHSRELSVPIGFPPE